MLNSSQKSEVSNLLIITVPYQQSGGGGFASDNFFVVDNSLFIFSHEALDEEGSNSIKKKEMDKGIVPQGYFLFKINEIDFKYKRFYLEEIKYLDLHVLMKTDVPFYIIVDKLLIKLYLTDSNKIIDPNYIILGEVGFEDTTISFYEKYLPLLKNIKLLV